VHLHVSEDPNISTEQPLTNFTKGEKIALCSWFQDP